MKKHTTTTKSVISFFETHAQSEQAVNKLYENGFEMDSFSIIAMNLCAVENVKGYYTLFDQMKKWGKIGAFYGGFWGLLFGANLFTIPFIGHLLLARPIAMVIMTLVCAAAVGIVSALGAALFTLNVPQKHKLKYETEIKAGKYMLVAQGDEEMINKAREILEVHIPKEFSFITEWELSRNTAQQMITKKPEAFNLDDL